MVDIYYKESVTGIQRETELENLRDEILMNNLIMEYTSVQKDYEIFLSEAALKVYSENGTKDDLITLYTEAENQTKEKKKGLLRRIFEVILSILGNIKKFFQGLFTKEVEDKMPDIIDLPQKDVDDVEKTCGILDKIKNILKKLGSSIIGGIKEIGTFLKEHPTYTIGGAIGAVSGTAMVIHHFKPDFIKNLFHKSDKKIDEVQEETKHQSQNEELLNGLSGAVVNSVAQATANSNSTIGQAVHAGAQAAADVANKEGLATKFFNWIRNCCDKFLAHLKNLKAKIFGKSKDTDNKKDTRTDEQVQKDVGKTVADIVQKKEDEKKEEQAKAEELKKKEEGVVWSGSSDNSNSSSSESHDISSNLTEEERKKKEEEKKKADAEKAKEQEEAVFAGEQPKSKKKASRKGYGMLTSTEIDRYEELQSKKHTRSLTPEDKKELDALTKKKKTRTKNI